MSGNTNQHISYSASDIEKYLKGELSAPEMHQLEKAALDDPFLADALEGMEMHHSTLHKDLDDLRERLKKRVLPPVTGSSWASSWKSVWKMAAVFILLIGLGGITYFSLLKKSSSLSSLARQEKKQDTSYPQSETAPHSPSGPAIGALSQKEAETNIQTDSAAITNPNSRSSLAKSSSPKTLSKDGSQVLTKNEDAVKAENAAPAFNYSTNPVSGLTITKDHDKLRDTPSRSLVFKDQPHAPYSQNYAGNIAGNIAPPAPIVVSGKVVDQNNKPLPGVSLSLDGKEKFTAVTDNNGQYNLRLGTQDSSARLRAKSVGYQDFAMSLSQENRVGNVIQLKPENSSLNEVVVVGYGSKKRKNSAQEETRERTGTDRDLESLNPGTEPVAGWPAYKNYLETNKTSGKAYPTITDSTIKGEVILSFRVGKNGGLSSFKIEKSLSPAHDSALIHLVQQGPAWKLIKGKRARATVALSF